MGKKKEERKKLSPSGLHVKLDWTNNNKMYCSITVANYQLITVIRFISKSYTHPYKNFANKLHLVLHAYEILFSKNVREKFP